MQGGAECVNCDAGYACQWERMAGNGAASGIVSCAAPSSGLIDSNPYKCTSCIAGDAGCRSFEVKCDQVSNSFHHSHAPSLVPLLRLTRREQGQYLNMSMGVVAGRGLCVSCPAGTFSSAIRTAASLSVAQPLENCTLCPVFHWSSYSPTVCVAVG